MKTNNPARAEAQRRPCPTCGAQAGSPCWQPNSAGFATAHPHNPLHQERYPLFRRSGVPSQELPEPEMSGKNLDESPMVISDHYSVCEWTPERDGNGTPEQVHLLVPVTLGAPGEPDLKFEVVMRLKSPRALDELVAVLLRHRQGVWGAPKQ